MRLQELVDKNVLKWSMPSPCKPDIDKWNRMFSCLLDYGKVYGHYNGDFIQII